MSTERVELPNFMSDNAMETDLEVKIKHINRGKRWARFKKGSQTESSVKPRSTSSGYTFEQ